VPPGTQARPPPGAGRTEVAVDGQIVRLPENDQISEAWLSGAEAHPHGAPRCQRRHHALPTDRDRAFAAGADEQLRDVADPRIHVFRLAHGGKKRSPTGPAGGHSIRPGGGRTSTRRRSCRARKKSKCDAIQPAPENQGLFALSGFVGATGARVWTST